MAEPSWQKICIGGQQVSMTAYNIAGTNYVKLMDISQAAGCNVRWSDGIQFHNDAPYTGTAPQSALTAYAAGTQAACLISFPSGLAIWQRCAAALPFHIEISRILSKLYGKKSTAHL